MSRNQRAPSGPGAGRAEVGGGPVVGVPTARRSVPPSWRNPRLIIGLVLVAASVLIGARVISGLDDTVGIWAVADDLPAGSHVVPEDLRVHQVRFPDEAAADLYLASTQQLPTSATLLHGLDAGELLPRSALATTADDPLAEVPLSVESTDLPATVRQGSRVDVWVAPKVAGPTGAKAARVLTDVVVVAVPSRVDSLAPATTRQVIVGLEQDRTSTLEAALGAMADARVLVVRRGADQ